MIVIEPEKMYYMYAIKWCFLNLIAFVHEVGMRVCVHVCVCVSAPKAINYIHVIFNLYNH